MMRRKQPSHVNTSRIAIITALLACGAVARDTSGQELAFSLFERYLRSLQQQARIPGLSAAIVHNRSVVWDHGNGLQDVERRLAAAPDTPYPIGDITQTFAATLVLQCAERGHLRINDRMQRWAPLFADPAALVRQIASHTFSEGRFGYDPLRFIGLTDVAAQCQGLPYRKALAQEILDRLGMVDTVPGQDLASPTRADQRLFDATTLERYATVLQRLAVPYMIDTKGNPRPSKDPVTSITAASGLISTVRELARFAVALDAGVLVHTDTLATMWTNTVSPTGSVAPMGFGWFVQTYNGERLIWHFGLLRGAASSLILKVPGRDMTLILLANSEGLSAPFALESGDVTRSLFALVFLRIFVG